MKYLIVDLDDTLLRSDKTVSEYTRNGIESLRKSGFLFVFNTARSLAASKGWIEDLKPDYAILNAGGMICDREQNILYTKEISIADTNYITGQLMKDESIRLFSVQTRDRLISKEVRNESHWLKYHYFDFMSDLNEPSMKIMMSSDNSKKWEQMAKDMGYEFERYFDGTWFRISSSNKYKGNQALFEILGDKKPMDYVFGDDHGDVEMIRNAFCGALLKNSRITDLSENVTEFDCDHDGVIRHMEKLLRHSSEYNGEQG